MPYKGRRDGKGAHRSALSLDSFMGNLTLTPKTEKGRSSVASDGQGDEVDIVIHDRLDMKPNMSIGTAAQDIVDSGLRRATYSQVGDTLAYGNSLGITLLEERDEYRSRWDGLEARMSKLQEKMASQEKVNSNLQARISKLESNCEGFQRIRSRFLDTYRRDVLEDPAAKWTTAIAVRNRVAHNGDAVADAGLYESGIRRDESLIPKIYGLNHSQILRLSRAGDQKSINILNARATMKADKEKPITQEIEDAFQAYISQLEYSWGESPTADPQSPLGLAYYSFWRAYGSN